MGVRVGVGGLAAVLAVAATLLVAPGTAAADPAPVAGLQVTDRVLLVVRVDGYGPVTVDTTRLAGPRLRAWWVDLCDGRTIDLGSVPRQPATKLFPPNTGDGVQRSWLLVIVDAAAVPVPLAPRHAATSLPPCSSRPSA